MPETLDAALVTAKNALLQSAAWIWLVRADIDGTNGAFICSSDASVTYGGNVYSPYPMRVEGFESNDDTIPYLTLVVSNAGGEISTRLEAGYLLGRTVKILLVSRSDVTKAMNLGTYYVDEATLTDDECAFALGTRLRLDATFPNVRQNRTRCSYVYGSTSCGYIVALPNLISGNYPDFDGASCDFSLDGGNGCTAHGLNEAATGTAVRHPGRWGGEHGIPKGPARL